MHSILPAKASVVIIGAGPTGLTAANLLGQAGIETILIERNTETYAFPRAIAIDDEGLRVLQAAGLLEEIRAHIRPNVQAHYLSPRHFLAKVAPQEQRNGFPLISTFHQPTLERILLKGVERFPCVKVFFEHTLEAFAQDEQGVHVSIRTSDDLLLQVECSYLLACDGGKSSIRRMLNITMHPPTRQRIQVNELTDAINRVPTVFRVFHAPKRIDERTESQKWLVVDAIGESEPADTILFLCDPARPAVSVPGPGTQRRWEFMLRPGEHEEDLLGTNTIFQLISHTLQNITRNAASSTTDTPLPLKITRQTIYTFHALIAARFSLGRTFLLGDAAHLMPPFGGQGMNSGLRDAHNLCWKLQMVLQNTADATLLASYHIERYPHVAQMIMFSSLLGKVIMTTQRSTALLRDLFFRIIAKLSPAREMLTEMRIKPQPRYTDGFLLKNSPLGTHKLVGSFLPQPYVQTQEGKRVLLDEVLGNGFALIRLCENEHEAFAGIRHDIWERLNVKFVCVRRGVTLRAPGSWQRSRSGRGRTQGDAPTHIASEVYKPQLPVSAQAVTASTEKPQDEYSTYIIDFERQIGKFLHNRHDLYVLVRPDRYVMGVFQVQGIRRCEEDLQNLLSTNLAI